MLLNFLAIGFFKARGMNPYIGADLQRICEATGRFSKIKYDAMLIPVGSRDGEMSKLVCMKDGIFNFHIFHMNCFNIFTGTRFYN